MSVEIAKNINISKINIYDLSQAYFLLFETETI